MPSDFLNRALANAQRLHESGRLQEAEQAYRRIVAADSNAEANHLLGLLLHQTGRSAEGAPLIEHAIAIEPGNAIYRSNLGVVLKDVGRLEDAVASYEAALAIDPALAQVHSNLGVALLGLKRTDSSVAAQRRALELLPDYAEAHANLGLALMASGQPDEAIESYRRAVALRPGYANAHLYLAEALRETGRLDEAEASARTSLALRPEHAATHHALGAILAERGQLAEAAESYRTAVRLEPNGSAYRNLGNILNDLGRYRQAAAALESALGFDPDDAAAIVSLGLSQVRLGNGQHALELFRRAVELRPDDIDARIRLGGALVTAGRLDEGMAEHERVIALDPDNLVARGGRLFLHNYLGDRPIEETFAEAVDYGRRLESQVVARRDHANNRDPGRRLRIGLVSGDFRRHPVARFLEAVLAELDPREVELFGYFNSVDADENTPRFQAIIPNWRAVAMLDNDRLEQLIVDDGIDILLDLSGHSARNRLNVFARKPAPIAVTWLGYFATTGLTTIDYVLCNDIIIPPSEENQWVEKPWRLPETYLCFSAPKADVPLAEPPARRNGYVTFGSANNINKLSAATVETWASVMQAVPKSRLFLRSTPLAFEDMADATRNRFAALGIDPARLVLEGSVSNYAEYLAKYNEVDISLDPFPYAGGTTSVESLWMGVPVLTLKGDRYVAHMGENIATQVGLPEWIAATRSDYVAKAAAFSADLDSLATLRASLRQRLSASSLLDAPRFARNLEAAFRGMWRRWLATAPTSAER